MIRQLSIEIFIVLTIGLLLGLIGPYGTFESMPGVRIAFWVVTCLVGYAIFRPFLIVSSWVSEATGLPQLVGGGLALMIAAAPLTYLIALYFSGFDLAGALLWQGLPGLYLQVWLIGFVINAVFCITLGRANAMQGAGGPALPPEPQIMERSQTAMLPDRIGAVHALKGEDHYVRVFSDAGEELVLMRLRDAILQFGADNGVQVHRSWWVANSAIGRVTRTGRTAEITLTNGIKVPVARDAMPRLRDLHRF
jgi:hypothetical protein